MPTTIRAVVKLLHPYAAGFAMMGLAGLALPALSMAQQPANPAPNRVANIMGFEDIKKNEKCELVISASLIRLKGRTSTVELVPSSIEDVLTGEDSARLVGGFVGTLSSFAPYESGRFLSLFRKKLDTLTIEYRDVQGGLHGGILSMKPGQAAAMKKLIVATGARTTVPIEEAPKPTTISPATSNDHQKNSEKKP
jgi:hypothetical protein